MSSKRWAIAFGVLALATAASAAAQSVEVASLGPFVRVAEERFERAGIPFRFVGANVAVMHGEAHRAALASTLDAVQADGLSVIRVWALGERDAGAPDWARSYAFRIGETGWVESSFVHLDHVLVEAAARDLSVIIVLANRWGDYGGIPQYLRWSGEPFDTTTHDGIARAELSTFFHSARAQALYTAHIEHVVGRINSITGVAYRDDPTIFAWELVNEISAERRDAGALTSFVATNARRIHTLDPNHLVSAGHIGYATAADRRTWRDVVALPEVDFADAHAYPTEHDRVQTLADLDAFVDDQAMLAHGVLHKPLVFGELGFAIGRRSLGQTRTQLFEHFLDHAAARGVDGALAWIYAPSSDRAGAQTILADHPDADSQRVRAALSSGAHELAAPFTAASWPSESAPLWDPSRTVVGTRRVFAPIHGILSIAPEAFARARFEWVGAYAGGAIAHVYGGGHGWVEYRFRAPRLLGASITVSMRASSELPGTGVGAHADDGSRVWVSIDDEVLGSIDVPPDDGIGRGVAITVPIDDAIASALRGSGVRTLRFQVDDDDDAHGLCLYGAATGLEALDPSVAAQLPGRVEITFGP